MYSQQQQTPFVQSQYRGFQQKFQPTGPVPSYYQGTAQTTQFQPVFQSQQPLQTVTGAQQAQFVNQQSFHAANYRGNQPGHDNYLRADATTPTNAQFAGGQYGIQAGVSTNQFHTANYRGNQPGHDNYLRSDSMNPSSSQGFAAGTTAAYGTGTIGGISQYQAQSPQSFHTANYRGDQPGHDNYLRADSTNPSGFPQYGIR